MSIEEASNNAESQNKGMAGIALADPFGLYFQVPGGSGRQLSSRQLEEMHAVLMRKMAAIATTHPFKPTGGVTDASNDTSAVAEAALVAKGQMDTALSKGCRGTFCNTVAYSDFVVSVCVCVCSALQ